MLDAAGVSHVAHGESDPVQAAVEATAPAGLPLLAPAATWAGVTRDDEPGCEDAARHRGTVLRMVARDTVVAQRLSRLMSSTGRHALVVAGDHEYGRQLDGQLSLAGLARADEPGDADVVVLAGLSDGPEIAHAADLAPLPVIAFDGVQRAQLGAGREVHLALPFASSAATTISAGGADERAAMLAELRRVGHFDAHGDPFDPPVWLWRARDDWTLEPDEAI